MNIHSFTGHRPDKIGGYSPSASRMRINFAKVILVQCQVDKGVSGMALGWDQAVAAACAELGIPFIAAIPFEGQESRWPSESRRYYEKLVRRAHQVVIVSGSRPETNSEAAGMLHKRNEWMVDNSTHLIALWNGDRTGGTAACVRYAEKRNRHMINCWSEWTQYQAFSEILG